MGIQGLLSVCLQQRDKTAEIIDLVEEARLRNGLEILCDFYSFEHFILKKFWTSVSQLRNNEYLHICGGEYGSLDAYIRKFVTDLKSLGISLVFYIDAAKGCSTEATRQKIDTWMERHHKDIQRLNEIMDVCRGIRQINDLHEYTTTRPVLLEIQFVHALRDCGCEIIQMIAGEADLLIAKDLQRREKAFAVISNDSDFCIFRNCRFIPNELFDIENDLQLGQPLELPEKPVRLKVGIITPQRVMDILGINNHHVLIELSIVAGNDFTAPFMRQGGLQKKLDIQGRINIESIAGWIRHYTKIENHHGLAKELNYNRPFASAVQHSRAFYDLTLEPEGPARKGYVSNFIEEGVQQGKFASSMISMHNNFYWHRMLLEDTTYGQPCAECALAELRGYVYRIVLPRHESMVNEYGRSPYEPLRIAGILAVDDGAVPSVHRIQENKVFQNLKHFHYIMIHQEPETEVYWFDRYGRKNGFIVYLLRYFLILNWGRNLYITEPEFLALCAMAFGRPKEAVYQQIRLRPTPRCVTIGNWFQDLYRHAYQFLGHLLYLKHEFPLPAELICGSVWTTFYTSCKDETFYAGVQQVHPDALRRTQMEMNKIIKEKRHMIKYIVEGVFHFDDRF